MRQILLLVLVLLLFLPAAANKRKVNPSDYQNLNSIFGSGNFNLAMHQADFSQNLARGVSRLRFLADVSPLLIANTFPTSFQVEIFKVVAGQRESLAIYRPTVLSQKKAKNFVFDIDLVSLTQTSNIEIDVYDVRNALNTIFKTDITIENPSKFAFSTLSNSSCQGDFGECQLEYIVKNIQFATGPNQGIETKVEKNPDGSYLVSLPLSKSNRATRIINRINGNSGSGNSNLNFEFDGTNLFVVADDGTKTQVAAQGPQGEAGEAGPAGANGQAGPQGPRGATGIGVTGAAGATGAVQFNAGGALAADTTNFYWDDTNDRLSIGGNTSPFAPLQIETNVGGSTIAYFRDNAQFHNLNVRSINNEGIQLRAGTGDRLILSGNGSTDPHLAINFQGNVGLGTFDPNQKLQVNGDILLSGHSPSLIIGASNNAGPNTIVFNDDGVGSDAVQIAYRTTPNTLNFEDASNSNIIFAIAHDDYSAYFNGNVGIGVENPSQELHVNGDIIISGNSPTLFIGDDNYNGPNSIVFADDTVGNDKISLLYRTSYNQLRIEDTSTSNILFSIDHDDQAAYFNGNLGVAGIATPLRSIHIGEAMRLEPQTSPPSSPALGDIYVDDSEAVCVYVDSAWTKLAGSGSCI